MEVEQLEDHSNNQSLQGGDSSYMPPPANDKVSLNDASAENPLLNDGLLPSERKPLLIEQQRQQQIPNNHQYGLSSTNPNQFYTVTVDVYKAARINSILSELNFRDAPSMDPKAPRILLKIEQEDTVIQEIKKREVAYRKKLNEVKREDMKRRKIQEREHQKKIDRDKKRYQQPTSYTSTQYQQQVNEAIAKQEIQQQTQQQYEQDQAITVENKIERKPSVDMFDEAKNKEDSKADSNVEIQVGPKIENPNLELDQAMVTEQNSQENDMSKLSPTPRKSERENKIKNYKVLNDGRMSAEEEENNPLGQTTINLATGNPLGPQASKPQSQRNLIKTDPPKAGKNITLEKMTELLERMKNHRFAHLFNCVKDTQQTLVMIVLNLKIGKKYTNTNQIGRDMREMVMKQIEATLKEGKNDEYQQIVQFLDEFDEGFKNLDNLSLVKGPDVAPPKTKPNPASGSTKVTQPPKFTGSKPVTEIKTSKKEPQAKSTGKPVIPQTTPVKAAQAPGGYVQQATNGAIKNDGQTSSGIINISTSNVQKMTQDEIDQLKDKINNKLNPEQQRGIVEIIKKDPIYQVSLQESGHNGQLELDLDKLTPEVARELEVYVNKEININNRRIKRQAADKARRQRQQAIKQQKQQLEKQRDQQQDASKDVTALAALQANPQLNMQHMKGGQVMPQGQVLAGGQSMAVNPLNQAQLIAAAQLNNLNQANLAGFQLQNAAIGKGQNIQPNQAQLHQLLLQQQLAAQNPGALQNIMNQQAAQQALQKQAQLQVQSQVPAANKEEDNESSESSSDDDSD